MSAYTIHNIYIYTHKHIYVYTLIMETHVLSIEILSSVFCGVGECFETAEGGERLLHGTGTDNQLCLEPLPLSTST